MSKIEDFFGLGNNRTNGQAYIGLGAKEQPYRLHSEIVSAIFVGPAVLLAPRCGGQPEQTFSYMPQKDID